MENTESAVESPLLTTKETCKYLRLGRTKVNSLRRSGEIRVVYLAGRSPRYLKSDLDAFIERRRFRCGA
jgi:excisionase family DNA binding protein